MPVEVEVSAFKSVINLEFEQIFNSSRRFNLDCCTVTIYY